MPSVSGAQQRLFGAAYARKKAGHPRASDPKMPLSSLRDFASTPRRGLPDRVGSGQGQRGRPHRAHRGGRYGQAVSLSD